LLVNELAPRPHNSYHSSERACVTGQFEQLVRAICGLPLGSPQLVRPTAIVNLLGDLWQDSGLPNITDAMQVPETRIHLYGKASARPGRKMGHLSATGDSSKQALDRALLAYEKISGVAVQSSQSLA
jgi:5-(carboxyamino)imidazole ribonucleotide synthase